jgi:hypothetical protein
VIDERKVCDLIDDETFECVVEDGELNTDISVETSYLDVIK